MIDELRFAWFDCYFYFSYFSFYIYYCWYLFNNFL